MARLASLFGRATCGEEKWAWMAEPKRALNRSPPTISDRMMRLRRPNPLVVIFLISFTCFAIGLTLAAVDIDRYGAGLYLALVSIVVVVVVFAFCLVGTEEQTEPTVAKKVWSHTRDTIRRYTRKETIQRAAGIEIRVTPVDEVEEVDEIDDGGTGSNEAEEEEEDEEEATML